MPDNRIALAEEIEALMGDAYPTPWVERPQEYDDWGVIRTTGRTEDGFYPIACVARGDDDQAEQSLARQQDRQPKRIGANSALIAKVFGALPTILAALRADHDAGGAVAMREVVARLKQSLDDFASDGNEALDAGERPDLWDQVVEVPIADVRAIIASQEGSGC